jgi:hypothetical protein
MEQLHSVYNTLHSIVAENSMLLTLLGGASLVLFVGTLLAIPWLIMSIPRDYFMHSRPAVFGFGKRHPVIRLVLLIAKNAAGIVCIVSGFVMLFIPGQGLLTMFIGVLLLNFPGKRRLELGLVRQPKIQQGIKWIRRRAGKRPLQLPGERESNSEDEL